MVVKLWQLRSLKQMQSMATAENKADVGNVIKLYQDRTIGKYTTALKLASQLADGKNSQKAGRKGLAMQYGREPETGKLRPPVAFFISGVVKTTSKYSKTTNKGTTEYNKVYKDSFKVAKTITARSAISAVSEFKRMVRIEFEADEYSKKTKLDGEVEIKRVQAAAAYKPTTPITTSSPPTTFIWRTRVFAWWNSSWESTVPRSRS